MNQEKKFSIPLLVGGLVLVIVLGVGGVSMYVTSQNKTNTQNNIPPQSPTHISPTPTVPQSSINNYKNGTYTASGSYSSPAGSETIDVSLTIADNTITAVSITPHPDNPTTSQYQNRFKNGVSGRVIGKKIDNARISIADGNVNGSSLTLNGFNRALETIKTQAKV